jgi:hypothetical protein
MATWLDVFKAFDPKDTGSVDRLECPNCGVHAVELQYVADRKDRIGTLDMWCRVCNHGVHFFRVRVPEEVPFMDKEDKSAIAERIPRYTPMQP